MPPRRAYLIWVPLVIIGLAILGWVLLSLMPFSRELRPKERPEMEVVAEGRARTTTVEQIGETEPVPREQPPRREEAPVLSREATEAEAARALGNYILSRRDYGMSQRCLQISPVEYRNRGYTFDARDGCEGNSLGRWRVDSEDLSGIFRQRADGRYLRP